MKIKYEASRETFKYYNELTVISQRLKKIEKAGNIIRVASCQEKCNRLCLRRRFPV